MNSIFFYFKYISELIGFNTKSSLTKKPLIQCAQCGYELPKAITMNIVPKDIENRIKDMLVTIYCPHCDKPYYSVTNKEQRKDDVSCYS